MSSEHIEGYSDSVVEPLESSVSTLLGPLTHEPSMRCEANGFQLQGITAGVDQTPPVLQRYVLNINLKQGRNLVASNKRSGEEARHSGPDRHPRLRWFSYGFKLEFFSWVFNNNNNNNTSGTSGMKICESVHGRMAFAQPNSAHS